MYLVIIRAESRGSLLSGLMMKINPESKMNTNKCPVNNVLYNPSNMQGRKVFCHVFGSDLLPGSPRKAQGLCSALPSVNNFNVDLLIYSPSTISWKGNGSSSLRAHAPILCT